MKVFPKIIGTINFKSGGDDTTAARLHLYLRISHGSVSTEYNVGPIKHYSIGTVGTTGYI
jgi:hypothetical protein